MYFDNKQKLFVSVYIHPYSVLQYCYAAATREFYEGKMNHLHQWPLNL